jgi:hypothetical protein
VAMTLIPPKPKEDTRADTVAPGTGDAPVRVVTFPVTTQVGNNEKSMLLSVVPAGALNITAAERSAHGIGEHP